MISLALKILGTFNFLHLVPAYIQVQILRFHYKSVQAIKQRQSTTSKQTTTTVTVTFSTTSVVY